MDSSNTQYIVMGIGALVVGYVGFWIMFAYLKVRLRSMTSSQQNEMVRDAEQQAKSIRTSEKERIEALIQTQQEELEEELQQRDENMKLVDEELVARHSSMQREESRLQKMENDIKNREKKLADLTGNYKGLLDSQQKMRQEYVVKLGSHSQSNPDQMCKTMSETIIDERQLQCQKVLNFLDDELNSMSKKNAIRMMNRVMSRYSPDFYWPKSVNIVELADASSAEALTASRLLEDMKEIAGIEIDIPEQTNPDYPPYVKLAGGAGINREAVRLAMTEMVPKGANSWSNPQDVYQKHRDLLEHEAVKLGSKAIHELRLHRIHPEIQKLVGYLNWRTSYRQNQWYHTVEVAKLAGILGHELGVDPDFAKRCGLLHDIGKAIDYRIEGSHAVISGDYADRFGETRLICDTVMSHHNDLIVETPLSFVLKAADTLSGARPGARVNLEEGYQMRLSGIDAAVRSFPGVVSVAIMNGAREVHVEVNNKKVKDSDLQDLTTNMAAKVSEEVAFPGEIKILVSRRFEATSVA